MSELPETAELETFVRVVETGSISRAARELGVPRPTIGRRLARLEDKLGVRLLRRTTRAMAITDAGEALFAQARAILESLRHAEASLRQGAGVVRGTIRVSTPPLATLGFARMLGDFVERFPEVRIEHHASTRHVDLIAGGYDVALRAGIELTPGLVARPIARTQLIAVASPAYLSRAGTPRTARELAKHRCVAGFAQGERPATRWPLARGGQVAIEAVLASNDMWVLREAAIEGRGIALVPALLVHDALEDGRLVTVLEGRVGATSQVAVVYPERELLPEAVRRFIDALVRWAREEPTISRGVSAQRATR